jgi:hypothetical protein
MQYEHKSNLTAKGKGDQVAAKPEIWLSWPPQTHGLVKSFGYIAASKRMVLATS